MSVHTRPRVLCTMDFAEAPEALAIIHEVADVDCVAPDRRLVLEAIGEHDAVWTGFDVKLDREVLSRAPRLKVVNTATTGTDHIDREYLAERGIALLSIKADYDLLDRFTATAECAWMLLLACVRHLRRCLEVSLSDSWERREALRGRQLSNMTLGVLGVGRLGKMTVQYGKAFRMRVLGCDPREFDIPGVERVGFDELLARADAISIHIHLSPETRHTFDEGALARTRRGAVLVNTSRGDIVDEEAVIRALESGQLAAYGTDVVSGEWRGDMSTSPVVGYARTHPNVVITPHVGGNTDFSVREALVFSARKLARFLATGGPR